MDYQNSISIFNENGQIHEVWQGAECPKKRAIGLIQTLTGNKDLVHFEFRKHIPSMGHHGSDMFTYNFPENSPLGGLTVYVFKLLKK